MNNVIFNHVNGGVSVVLNVDSATDLASRIALIFGVELVCSLPFVKGYWVAFTDDCFLDGKRIETEIRQLLNGE